MNDSQDHRLLFLIRHGLMIERLISCILCDEVTVIYKLSCPSPASAIC